MDFFSLRSSALEVVKGHTNYILALQEAQKASSHSKLSAFLLVAGHSFQLGIDLGDCFMQGCSSEEITRSYLSWALDVVVVRGLPTQ